MSSDGYSDDDFTDESSPSASKGASKAPSPTKHVVSTGAAVTNENDNSDSSSSSSSSSTSSTKSSRSSSANSRHSKTEEKETSENNQQGIAERAENNSSLSANENADDTSLPKGVQPAADSSTSSSRSSSSSSKKKVDVTKADDNQSRSGSAYGDGDFDHSDADTPTGNDQNVTASRKQSSTTVSKDATIGGKLDGVCDSEMEVGSQDTQAAHDDNDDNNNGPSLNQEAQEQAETSTAHAVSAPRGGVGRRGLLPPTTTNTSKKRAPRELSEEEAEQDRKNRAFFLKQSRGKLDIYDPYKGKFAIKSDLKISNAAAENLTSRLYQPETLKLRTQKDLEQRRAEAKVYNYDSAEDKHLKEFWRKRRALDEAAAVRNRASDDEDHHDVPQTDYTAQSHNRKDSLTLSFGSEPADVGHNNKTYPTHAPKTLTPHKNDTSQSYTVPRRLPPAPRPRAHKFSFTQIVEYIPPVGHPSTRNQGGAVGAVSSSRPNQPDTSVTNVSTNNTSMLRRVDHLANSTAPDEDNSLIKRQDKLRIRRERATQKGQMRAVPDVVVVFKDEKDEHSVLASEKYNRPLSADSQVSGKTSPQKNGTVLKSSSPPKPSTPDFETQPITSASDTRQQKSEKIADRPTSASSRSSRPLSPISRSSSQASSAASSRSGSDSYGSSSNYNSDEDSKGHSKELDTRRSNVPTPTRGPRNARPASSSVRSNANVNAAQNRSSTPVESPTHSSIYDPITIALPPPVTSIRRKDLTALWMMADPPPGMGGVRSLDIAKAERSGVDLSWMAAKRRILKRFKEELPSPHRYGRDKYRLTNQHEDDMDDEPQEKIEEIVDSRPSTSNVRGRGEHLSRPASEVTNARIAEANSVVLTSPAPENPNSRAGIANAFTGDLLLNIMKRRTVAAESLQRMRNRKLVNKDDSDESGPMAISVTTWSTNSLPRRPKKEPTPTRSPSKTRNAAQNAKRTPSQTAPTADVSKATNSPTAASGTEKRYVPPIPKDLVTLLTIPTEMPDTSSEDADVAAEVNILRTLVINSPRSGLVLLRNGVTLAELLPTPLIECMRQGAQEHALPVAMEKRYLAKEAKRRRLLSKVREDYASVCAGISLSGLLKAFLNSDPSITAGVSFAADDTEVRDGDEEEGLIKESSGKSAAYQDKEKEKDRPSHPHALPMDQSAELLMKNRLQRYDIKRARATRQQELSLLLIKERCDRLKAQSDQEKAFEKRRREESQRKAAERAQKQEEREAKLAKTRQDAEDLDALNRNSIMEKIQKENEHYELRRAEELRKKAIENEAAKAAIRERQERVAQQERARQFELLCTADRARRKVDKVTNAKALSETIHKKLRDERDAMRRDEIRAQEQVAAEVLAFRRSNDV